MKMRELQTALLFFINLGEAEVVSVPSCQLEATDAAGHSGWASRIGLTHQSSSEIQNYF